MAVFKRQRMMFETTNKITRREIFKKGLHGGLATGLALSSSQWLAGCNAIRKKTKPNVLVVVLDTARADRFSCYGYKRKTSPNIDKLAAESTLYRQAYSTDFWTLPSHASLFTGLYPSQVGATAETNRLPESATTMAEVLQANGYYTAGFVCNSWVSKERGFAQGFAEFNEMWRKDAANVNRSEKPEQRATRKVTSWLDQRKGQDKPFFAFVNLNGIHMPYRPPEPYFTQFLSGKYKKERVQFLTKISGMWKHLAGKLKLNEEDYRILSDLYDAEVAAADYCVGQMVDRLKTMGVLDETLIIITSDHGENLGEHGMIDHLLSMHETTLHIPLVIRYPGKSMGGRVNNDLTSLVDIMPTVLDVCNLPSVAKKLPIAQRSLCDEDKQKRIFVVAENERPINGIKLMKRQYPSFDTTTIDYRMRAIRLRQHKLIWKIGGNIELFDLKNDPGELHDLADSNEQLRDEIHGTLKKWMKQIPTARDTSLFESTDEESLKILRSLGYME